MTMSLFKDEKQTDPQAMAKDVLTLYMLHYGLGLPAAAELLRLDLAAIVKQYGG